MSCLVGWLLYVIAVVYNFLDTWQTYLLINVGAVEANPFLIPFIESFGVINGLLIAKTPLLLILGVLLFFHSKQLIK